MTYTICYYKDGSIENESYALFDIEYYLEKSERTDEWYSELHCLPLVKGLTYFLRDKLSNPDFDAEQFAKDAYVIQELRGVLFEKFDNKPKEQMLASHFHHHEFENALKDIINSFTEKYGLYVNVD